MFDLQGYEASILKGAVLTIEVALLSLILHKDLYTSRLCGTEHV